MAQIVYNENEQTFDYVAPEETSPDVEESPPSQNDVVLGAPDDSVFDSLDVDSSLPSFQTGDGTNPAEAPGGTQSEQTSDSEENNNENVSIEDDTEHADSPESSASENVVETPSYYLVDSDDYIVYSSVADSAGFSPQSWQTAIASGRGLGEHYIIYGAKHYYGSGNYNYYWDYYTIVGKEIEFDESNSLYTYSDCDFYHYSNYDNRVTYTLSKESGTISGNSYLCYSDLYFDYVGVSPAQSCSGLLSVALLIMIAGLLVLNLRKR